MKIKKITRIFLTSMLVAISAVALAGCDNTPSGEGQYTYNTYTSVSPSNWNQLTYQDNNDTQILNYMTSDFFSFDFNFDDSGKVIPGDYAVKYSAATKLEDITSEYVDKDDWGISANSSNQVWKITLRNDLKWDDGTSIDASDFVYTMQQQLDPLFQNYRADSYYVGSTVIHNAKDYVYQGQVGWYAADTPYAEYSTDLDSMLVFSLGNTVDVSEGGDGAKAASSFRAALGASSTTPGAAVAGAIASYTGLPVDEISALEGKTLSDIKADPTLKATWDAIIGWWQTEPNEELDFFIVEYTWPEVNFEDVGIFVGDNNYELVLVLDNPLVLLNEDGSLSYRAAYNMAGLPLVHRNIYEANKVAPSSANGLWTSKYNTSVASSASWGPYKLTFFQSGKEYRLERNENWFGYGIDMYKDQYQTNKIVCETISEWQTAWVKFLAGEVDGISIQPTIAEDYKNSERAYFTADDYVGSFQLQSNADSLKSRQTAGKNKVMLTYPEFRKALSLSINRSDYTQKTTTSSFAGFGLYNSMHYYDVANAGVYRDTDAAKQVLCDVYGVNVADFDGDLDKAYESITGFDLVQARALLTSAYEDALAAGDISATDTVSLVMGTAIANETWLLQFEYIKNAWTTLCVGTPLEGRFELTYAEFGDNWSKSFRAGEYDVCAGGWTGAAWDPGYFLLAYLSPDYMYSAAWDTSSEMLEFTMPGVGADGEDVTDTLSLMDWYNCLNSVSGCKYSWGSGAIPEEKRLLLIAALEKAVLEAYYTVPVYNYFSASLLSYKVDYITYEYNTFMSYGGVRYMKYNYDDAAWAQVVKDNNNELDYK